MNAVNALSAVSALKPILFVGVVAGFLLLFLASNGVNALNLTTVCGTLPTVGEYYQLQNNVSSTGTCFTVSAANITIDCNGYGINFSSSSAGRGVYSTVFNTTVKNCAFINQTGTSDNSYGVYFNGGTFGNVFNNSITTRGQYSYVVYAAAGSVSNNISFNNITAYGYEADAVELLSNSNNVFNNTIYMPSGLSFQYLVFVYSNSNNIFNNNITAVGDYSYGVWVWKTYDSNNVFGNTISVSGDYAVGVSFGVGSDSNTVYCNNVAADGESALGFYSYGSSSNNVSYNNFTVNGTWSSGAAVYTSSTLDASSNNFVYNNITVTAGGVDADGLYLLGSSSHNFKDSNVSYNNIFNNAVDGRGIVLYTGSDGNAFNNSFAGNNVTTTGSGGYGFYFSSVQNSTLTGNRFNTSQANAIYVWGTSAAHYNQSIDASNLAEGLPIWYNYSVSNQVILQNTNVSNSVGQLVCAWCTNVTYDNVSMSNDGFSLFGTNGSTIANSSVNTAKGYSVDIYGGYFNNVSYSDFVTTGTGALMGIRVYSLSNSNNTFASDNVTTSGVNATGILFWTTSSGNVFSNVNVQTSGSGANAIWVSNNNVNFTVSDSVLNASKEGVPDFYADTYVSAAGSWNLTNVSFNKSDTLISRNGTLNVFWYVDAQVTDNNGVDLAGAAVNVSDVNGSSVFNATTNSTGWVARQTVLEYMQNATGIFNATPHWFNASLAGYASNYSQSSVTASGVVSRALFARSVDLETPLNGSSSSSYAQVFCFTPNSTRALVNASVLVGGVVVATNSSDLVNASSNCVNYTFAGPGVYSWSIVVYDAGGSIESGARVLTIVESVGGGGGDSTPTPAPTASVTPIASPSEPPLVSLIPVPSVEATFAPTPMPTGGLAPTLSPSEWKNIWGASEVSGATGGVSSCNSTVCRAGETAKVIVRRTIEVIQAPKGVFTRVTLRVSNEGNATAFGVSVSEFVEGLSGGEQVEYSILPRNVFEGNAEWMIDVLPASSQREFSYGVFRRATQAEIVGARSPVILVRSAGVASAEIDYSLWYAALSALVLAVGVYWFYSRKP